MKNIFLRGVAAFVLLTAVGCGGGGAEKAGQDPVKTIASVKLAGALPAGRVIGAIQLTITMPLGVTVQLDPVTKNPTPDVVKLIGATDTQMVFQGVSYTPATSTSKGELKFMVFNVTGFGSAESINVQLDVSPGFFPSASDFSLTDFAVSDITDFDTFIILNPAYTVQIT